MYFLSEKRTEVYDGYAAGVSDVKNALNAKSSTEVGGSANKQSVAVNKPELVAHLLPQSILLLCDVGFFIKKRTESYKEYVDGA